MPHQDGQRKNGQKTPYRAASFGPIPLPHRFGLYAQGQRSQPRHKDSLLGSDAKHGSGRVEPRPGHLGDKGLKRTVRNSMAAKGPT